MECHRMMPLVELHLSGTRNPLLSWSPPRCSLLSALCWLNSRITQIKKIHKFFFSCSQRKTQHTSKDSGYFPTLGAEEFLFQNPLSLHQMNSPKSTLYNSLLYSIKKTMAVSNITIGDITMISSVERRPTHLLSKNLYFFYVPIQKCF